jgi:predicted nucleic acid-binding protein
MSSRGHANTTVLDTNVVLDWLVFRDARVAPLVLAMDAGSLQVIATRAMREELSQMLASRRLARWAPDLAGVLTVYDRQVTVLPDADPRLAAPPASRPRCTDPDDQMFVDLALAAGARWLLTHDRALLKLKRRLLAHGVQAATPMHWAAQLGST